MNLKFCIWIEIPRNWNQMYYYINYSGKATKEINFLKGLLTLYLIKTMWFNKFNIQVNQRFSSIKGCVTLDCRMHLNWWRMPHTPSNNEFIVSICSTCQFSAFEWLMQKANAFHNDRQYNILIVHYLYINN